MRPDAKDVACRTKYAYATRSEAKRSLKTLRRQGRRELRIYLCWYCARFHLGNPSGLQTYKRPGSPPIGPTAV